MRIHSRVVPSVKVPILLHHCVYLTIPRLRNEAAFAHLCGAAPVPASSGKVVRYRLNPGGNRDANRALHVVALNRLRRDPRTQRYVARRTAEGKSKREAMRCLKRYIAREAYRAILLDAGVRAAVG